MLTDVKFLGKMRLNKMQQKKYSLELPLRISIIFPNWFLISLKKGINMDKSLDLCFIK